MYTDHGTSDETIRGLLKTIINVTLYARISIIFKIKSKIYLLYTL
jgi:hypothetical protein